MLTEEQRQEFAKNTKDNSGAIATRDIKMLPKKVWRADIIIFFAGVAITGVVAVSKLGSLQNIDGSLYRPQPGSIEYAETYQDPAWLAGANQSPPPLVAQNEYFQQQRGQLPATIIKLEPFLKGVRTLDSGSLQAGLTQILVAQESIRIDNATSRMMNDPSHECSKFESRLDCYALHLDVAKELLFEAEQSKGSTRNEKFLEALFRILAIHLLVRDYLGEDEAKDLRLKGQDWGSPTGTLIQAIEKLQESLEKHPKNSPTEAMSREAFLKQSKGHDKER